MKIARSGLRRRAGFTLVEVLIATLFMAIVLGVVMNGITLSRRVADDARRRTEAANLAQTKLSEIVAGQQWQKGNLSGDFSPNWPAYHWQMTVQPWAQDNSGQGIDEVDLTVQWNSRGHNNSLTLSTLAFPITQTQL